MTIGKKHYADGRSIKSPFSFIQGIYVMSLCTKLNFNPQGVISWNL